MAFDLKQRFEDLGRMGKRGLLYTIVGIAGLVTEFVRSGTARPFGLAVWALIIGIGLYFLFVMAGRRPLYMTDGGEKHGSYDH